MSYSVPPDRPSVMYKRSVQNHLLDARFQLKWTAYLIAVALAISAVLGTMLYRTSSEVTAQSQKVIGQGQELLNESRKNSELVRMSIRNFGDDSVLAESFAESDRKLDAELRRKQEELRLQQVATMSRQHAMLRALVVGLCMLVALIGILGIYVTHKLVGPIYKMKLLLKQVGDGRLNFQGRIRKGDELQDFFEVFATMVDQLKERQRREVDQLEEAIAQARTSGANAETMAALGSLSSRMRAALEQ